jgi:hypothetical protein
MRRKAIFLFLFLILPITYLWSQGLDIPLPKDAQETFRKDLSIGPTKGEIIRYETNLSKDKVISFFQKELPRAGWTQLYETSFMKKGYTLGIRFLPPRPKMKQQFMLVYAQIPTKEELEATQKEVPDRLKFMPVYPNAKQIFLWDVHDGAIASYQTPDSIQQVVFFYKSAMLNAGWVLYEETPIKQQEINKACPECEKKATDEIFKRFQSDPSISSKIDEAIKTMNAQGIRLSSSARIAFRKGEQRCMINLVGYDIKNVPKEQQDKLGFDQESMAQNSSQLQGTQISVSYMERVPGVLKPPSK